MRRLAAFRIGVVRLRVVALLGLLLVAFAPAAGARSEAAGIVASGRAARVAPTRLVFAATIARDQPQIFSVEPSGRAPAQLGHVAIRTRVLYASDWSGHMEIYAVDPGGRAPPGQITSGSDEECGTFLPCGFVDPIVSPNGKFVLYRGSASGSLWVARADGSGARLLGTPRPNTQAYFPFSEEASWSPDSQRVAYGAADGVHVVDADGRDDRVVASSLVGDVGWTHDGRSVFVLDRSRGLYVARARVERLLATDLGDRMAVSRDGRWIATTSTAGNQPVDVFHVSGRAITRITAGRGVSAAWSPDGRRLAIEGRDGIRVFDLRTRRARWLTRDVGFASGTANPEGLGMAWAPNGRSIAYIVGSIDGFFFGGIVNGDLRTVTLSGQTRTVVSTARAYGGRMVSLAWATSAERRYRRPDPEPQQRVGSDSALADGPVERLAADGSRVAFVSCSGVFAWTPSAQTVTPLALFGTGQPAACFDPTNFEIYDLALAGDRLVYATSDGCNSIQITLHLENLAPPQSGSDIAQSFGHCGEPFDPALGELAATDWLFVYGEWWQTSAVPFLPPFATTREKIHRIDGNGCPCPTIASSPGPLYPADADGGRVVAYGTNATLLLDRDGHQLLSLPISPLAAQLSGTDLVLLLPGEIRDYDTRSGALLHSWPIPDVPSGPECAWQECTDARLALGDAARGLVAYTLDEHVHLLRLADGADATVAAGTLARFMDDGLVYADGARLHLVPFARLPLK